MMKGRIEDLLGKALMAGAFSYLTFEQVISVIATIRFRHGIELWPLALTSRVFGLVFLVLIVFFTITRLPPKDSAAGIEPRLTAIAGTFILMILVVLPTGSVGLELRVLATILVVVGTLLSIYCLCWLRRSFSIMATARRLVTNGPYSIVRHPLYVAEALTVIGVVISNWSMAALAVGIAQFALQFRRMQNEERVLRSTFPEYDDYASRVPMFIPRPPLPKLNLKGG